MQYCPPKAKKNLSRANVRRVYKEIYHGMDTQKSNLYRVSVNSIWRTLAIRAGNRLKRMGKTRTEWLTDVAQLLLDIYDYPFLSANLRTKMFALYIKIWAAIIPDKSKIIK